jgi:hypothetical protein
MRYFLLVILLLLLVGGLAHAAIFPCSNESSESALSCTNCDTMGLISVTATPANATITLDPGLNTSYTGISQVAIGREAGTYSFVVSLTGYTDYSGQYQICPKRVTHVSVTLTKTIGNVRLLHTIALQPLTSPPTTAITTAPGITTQVTGQVTTLVTAASTSLPVQSQPAGTAAPQDTLGALTVTTTPAGALILIDGVQRGVSPATIPGLSAGTHTVLLKIDGYQDLSTPVVIAAGKTQDYATSLVKNSANSATTVATANATAGTTKGVAPGFEAVLGIIAIGAILAVRRIGRK